MTPRDAASFSPSRTAASASLSLYDASTNFSRKSHADSSRRTPVGSPCSSTSTTPPSTRRSPSRVRERRGVQPHRVAVARRQRRRDVAGDRVEHLPRRLDRRRPVAARASRGPRSQPPGGTEPTAAAHALDRLLQRPRPLEAHLVLRERPRDEVDVRVREAGKHAAAAEIDDLRRRKRRLVRADAAGDPVAGDRERPRDRQRRVERPDDAVLEDHAGRILPCSTTSTIRRDPPRASGSTSRVSESVRRP